jgi:hypothetical protein
VPICGILVCSTLVIFKIYEAISKTMTGNWDRAKSPPWLSPALAGGLVVVIVILYFIMRPAKVVAEEVEE